MDKESGLTDEERAVVDHLATAWHIWIEQCDPEELEQHEFMLHLNALMNCVAYRIATRDYPEYWKKV